jgi:hypothetical protein
MGEPEMNFCKPVSHPRVVARKESAVAFRAREGCLDTDRVAGAHKECSRLFGSHERWIPGPPQDRPATDDDGLEG